MKTLEIGGLGFFNSIAAGKQTLSVNSGAAGSFAELVSTVLSGKAELIPSSEAAQSENLESLGALAEMININDLLDLEDGLKLLDVLKSDTGNLLPKALAHFGINKEDLKLFIQKWTGNSENDIESISEDELLSSLAVIITGIANQNGNQILGKIEQNDLHTLKALKLLELMTKYADGNEYKSYDSVKESLKNLGEELKNLFETSKPNPHTDYFQKRFTLLASDLNLVNSKKMTLTEGSSALKTDSPAGTVAYLPQMTKVEQLMLTMNSPERPVSPEQLMKQFESILSKSHFMNSGGTQKLFIKLFPEHLGSIRIELFQKDQTMMARIITTSGTAKETLESHINGLKQAFAAQNLSVERIEVTQQQSQQERFLNRDSQQQERQPNRGQRETKEETGDFNLSFEEALLNTEV
ncbi:flagellar hook-length control protein FliK [Mesobacillus subterraneus]|uniref:flagellar hook-length control protein FliK n=1 Tax=Mesobacillus subterraneus TaxID=285983 RepID=UPI001CFE9CEA|nr:flagellar hook-length control protein FliK [Mesobacillus subterraneus]WLR53433.1 flagellar hook-length control protein FliK [Mesobacillus subterraneus]